LLVPNHAQLSGHFSVTRDISELTVNLDGSTATVKLKVQGDRLVPPGGSQSWVRQADVPSPPPAPMPSIAPPPPPTDAPPPTIELGQSKDQVTAGFGQPLRVANLGAKSIFYYKDMKVTFMDGKVSNVE
jgi:hypothetical protein